MGYKTLQMNYAKLELLGLPIGDMRAMESFENQKSKVSGFMDLNYDFLREDRPSTYIIALSHYGMMNGDMMADPDMEIRICPNLKIIEAMTFQQDGFPPIYNEVYDRENPKKYNPRLYKSLNLFLGQWLTNLHHQGHSFQTKEDLNQVS
jgi:uncharacterized protein YqiB (DUF1249 family)